LAAAARAFKCMSVIHVGKSIRFDLAGQKVDPVDIASCLVAQVIRFEHDFVILVEISGQGTVDGFADSATVSVVGVITVTPVDVIVEISWLKRS